MTHQKSKMAVLDYKSVPLQSMKQENEKKIPLYCRHLATLHRFRDLPNFLLPQIFQHKKTLESNGSAEHPNLQAKEGEACKMDFILEN